MKDINSEINNLNLEQLRVAIDQENNELLKEMYYALIQQQEVSLKQQKQIKGLQNGLTSITKIVEKIVAKIEILHQFSKKIVNQ